MLLVLLLGVCYALVWILCVRQTGGVFNYALDDPYIHLSIAKNVAFHDVWGVTAFAPSSASSSPLWTGLLALGIRVGGVSDRWPITLGILSSIAATLLVYRRFIQAGIGTPFAVVFSLLVFAVGPLLILPFTGMEHCLQILMDLVFGFWLMDAFARKRKPADLGFAVAITMLMCLCRYESVFLVVVPIGVGLWRRDWRFAVALAAGPLLAIGGFGLYSHMVGMPLIPNSILIKGNVPRASVGSYLSTLGYHTFRALTHRSAELCCLFVLCAAALFAMRWRTVRDETEPLRIWGWTVLVACVMHAGLATIGIFYRYEAYLVVCLLVVSVLAIQTIPVPPRNERAWSALKACAPLFVGLLVIGRAITAVNDIPKASRDIYLQQLQMARFVSRYYATGRVAANDIGAITYYSRVHLLDLVGLASDDIRKLRMTHNFRTEMLGASIDAFAPDLIVAYPEWFKGRFNLPPSIIPVADWTIPPVTSAASRKVTFYATSLESARRLKRELAEFQASLPAEVTVDYSGL
jgi:hypothetical protein